MEKEEGSLEPKPSNSSAESFLVCTRGKAAPGTCKVRRMDMGLFHPHSGKWMNCEGENITERNTWLRDRIWSWAEDSMGIRLLDTPLHLMKKYIILLCTNYFYLQILYCVNYTTVNRAVQFSSAPGSSEILCYTTKMCLYTYTFFFFWA